MLSGWSFFHRNNQHIDYEGPACFHEFEYSGKRIILIGDKHWGTDKQYELTVDQKRQYCNVFSDYISDKNSVNSRVRVYIEKARSDSVEPFEKWGFIDCIQSLDKQNGIEIVLADERRWDKGLVVFFRILSQLENLEKIIKKAVKNSSRHLPDPISFNEQHLAAAKENELIYCDKHVITLPQFFNLFTAQLDDLILLRKIYKDNQIILPLLEESYEDLHRGFTELDAIIEENNCVGETGLQNITLEELCIQMMLKAKNYSPVYRWFGVLDKYLSSHLDATLMCKLWNDLSDNTAPDIILLVAGKAHIDRLLPYLNATCNKIYNINQLDHSPPIAPDLLQNYLTGHESSDTDKSQCRIM